MPDQDPVVRSEEIDAHLAVLKADQGPGRWLLPVLLTIMLVGGVVNLIVLRDLTATSRRLSVTNAEALRTEIPGLKAQIAAREKVIADQRVVIDQAVEYLKQYAALIRELGGIPPPVVLQAPTTTTTVRRSP